MMARSKLVRELLVLRSRLYHENGNWGYLYWGVWSYLAVLGLLYGLIRWYTVPVTGPLSYYCGVVVVSGGRLAISCPSSWEDTARVMS